MAVTWAASAPHADAIKYVGASYGAVGVVADVPWAGNKRAKLTKLTATGTYTTGGDPIIEGPIGLSEIHAVYIVGSTDADFDILPANATDAAGVPQFNVTDPHVVLIKMVAANAGAAAEITAADVITGYEFHAIVVGI